MNHYHVNNDMVQTSPVRIFDTGLGERVFRPLEYHPETTPLQQVDKYEFIFQIGMLIFY